MWYDMLAGGVTGAVVSALLSFLLHRWLAVRLKAAIDHEYSQKLERFRDQLQDTARIRQARWEIKREACLQALAVVDSVYTNFAWTVDGTPVNIARERVDIAAARAAMNKLALACDGTPVLEAYTRALALRGANEPPVKISGDTINELRNAARKELGFGETLSLDPAKAWIALLPGSQAPNTVCSGQSHAGSLPQP